jgi:hypothetical protein
MSVYRISVRARLTPKKIWVSPFHKHRRYCIMVNGTARLPGRSVEDSKYNPVTEELRIRRNPYLRWLPKAKSWSSYFSNSIVCKRAKARVNNT